VTRAGKSWGILATLVATSTVARAWAGLRVPTPWIAPDEMIYGLLGRGLYHAGHLAILTGPTPFYSAVVPAVVGLPLSIGNLERGYAVLKVLQALLMSLAAVPVYVWGRSLMAPRWALIAAALTLALPGLAYSGLVMSEVAFYPVVICAVWAGARALESPTRGRQAVLVLASILAMATQQAPAGFSSPDGRALGTIRTPLVVKAASISRARCDVVVVTNAALSMNGRRSFVYAAERALSVECPGSFQKRSSMSKT